MMPSKYAKSTRAATPTQASLGLPVEVHTRVQPTRPISQQAMECLRNNQLEQLEELIAQGFTPARHPKAFYDVFISALKRGMKSQALLMATHMDGRAEDIQCAIHSRNMVVKAPLLHLAIRFGHQELVERWVSQRFNQHVTDSRGWPPLFWAVFYNEVDMAAKLLRAHYQTDAEVILEENNPHKTALNWAEVLPLQGNYTTTEPLPSSSSRMAWRRTPPEMLHRDVLAEILSKAAMSSRPSKRI